MRWLINLTCHRGLHCAMFIRCFMSACSALGVATGCIAQHHQLKLTMKSSMKCIASKHIACTAMSYNSLHCLLVMIALRICGYLLVSLRMLVSCWLGTDSNTRCELLGSAATSITVAYCSAHGVQGRSLGLTCRLVDTYLGLCEC